MSDTQLETAREAWQEAEGSEEEPKDFGLEYSSFGKLAARDKLIPMLVTIEELDEIRYIIGRRVETLKEKCGDNAKDLEYTRNRLADAQKMNDRAEAEMDRHAEFLREADAMKCGLREFMRRLESPDVPQ